MWWSAARCAAEPTPTPPTRRRPTVGATGLLALRIGRAELGAEILRVAEAIVAA
jgi:hypothetical protein